MLLFTLNWIRAERGGLIFELRGSFKGKRFPSICPPSILWQQLKPDFLVLKVHILNSVWDYLLTYTSKAKIHEFFHPGGLSLRVHALRLFLNF